ncbi:hypothetical protein AC629_21905 [Bradyrhizobium sp. NAS80.1]|uniref:hypothetical protein n=1 Tax=Bradyrhizobium sp. NAS80.1 TaxID=1680159 RepID=UPI000964D7A1|nr:hypothetical protein [Bradyrhizobium sp. NAS80.1]OKO84047.1 hypothetical protein AC629_21905 [Bradyrhizobium sp. NAS80.1]
MSTVAVFSLLIGSLLGGRFRIFILPPAIVIGAAILGAGSAWQGHTSAHTVALILVFAAVLQLGYFCGAFLVRVRAPAYRGKTAPSFDGRSFG